jgi:hypothetical protein
MVEEAKRRECLANRGAHQCLWSPLFLKLAKLLPGALVPDIPSVLKIKHGRLIYPESKLLSKRSDSGRTEEFGKVQAPRIMTVQLSSEKAELGTAPLHVGLGAHVWQVWMS